MRKSTISLFALVVLTTAPPVRSQTLEVIAVAGDTLPGTTDVIVQVGDEPVLNENGQVAIDATIDTGGGNLVNVLLRGESSTPLVEIARGGVAPPDGTGTMGSFDDYGLSDNGTLVFEASVTVTGIPGSKSVILYGDGTNPLVQIAREGDASPSGEPIDRFDSPPPRINTLGQIVFAASLDLQNGGSTSDEDVIYSWNGSGPLVEVVREGGMAPAGNVYNLLGDAVQNNTSQIAFQSSLVGGIDAIYRVDAGSTTVPIALEGQATPDGQGTFSSLVGPIMNESGVVAFFADVSGGTDGIFCGDGLNPVAQIIRAGIPSPEGVGTLHDVDAPAFSNTGLAAFVGNVDLGDGGSSFDARVIVLADGVNAPVLIAREDTSIPGSTNPDLWFRIIEQPAINERGQVAFDASVIDQMTTEVGSGVYFFDPANGLIEVVTLGTPLLGSTVKSVEFIQGDSDSTGNYADHNGMNSRSQVTFQFSLADGRIGVALWTAAAGGDNGEPIPINLSHGRAAVSGTLDSDADTDIYTFTLSGTNDVTLFTTGILDTRGILTGESMILINDPDLDDDAGADANFLTAERLPAGTYELAVSATTGGDYDLTLEAVAVSTPMTPPAASNALRKALLLKKIKKLKKKMKKAKKRGNTRKALKFRKDIKKLTKVLRTL